MQAEFVKNEKEEAGTQRLYIPVGESDFVLIPIPIAESDYKLIQKTMRLWKRRIIIEEKKK